MMEGISGRIHRSIEGEATNGSVVLTDLKKIVANPLEDIIMSSRTSFALCLLGVVAWIIGTAGIAHAVDITVCPADCDYTIIGDAIGAASSGDRVVVGTPGRVAAETYNEIIFMKSGVDVVSEPAGGTETTTYNDPWSSHSTSVLTRATLTILSGSGGSWPVVTFNENISASTVLDGFTVEDIQPSAPGYPLIAITGGGSNSQVTNCIIRNNQGAGQSAGIGTRGRWEPDEFDTAPVIDSDFIHYVNGPGVGNRPYSHATVTNNEIWDCNGNEGAGSPGIGLQGDTYPTITGNTVFECRAGIGSLGPEGDGNLEAMGGTLAIPTIKNNTIHDNSQGGIRERKRQCHL